jgi:hypothetical protein
VNLIPKDIWGAFLIVLKLEDRLPFPMMEGRLYCPGPTMAEALCHLLSTKDSSYFLDMVEYRFIADFGELPSVAMR